MSEFRFVVPNNPQKAMENWTDMIDAGMAHGSVAIYCINGKPGRTKILESVYIPPDAMTELAKWWLKQKGESV